MKLFLGVFFSVEFALIRICTFIKQLTRIHIFTRIEPDKSVIIRINNGVDRTESSEKNINITRYTGAKKKKFLIN